MGIKLSTILKEIEINSKLYISKSNIHGNGLFTHQPIPQNQYFAIIGDNTKYNESNYNDVLNKFGNHINHSKNANIVVKIKDDKVYMYSIKPIQAGEELVADYTKLPEMFSRNVDGFK